MFLLFLIVFHWFCLTCVVLLFKICVIPPFGFALWLCSPGRAQNRAGMLAGYVFISVCFCSFLYVVFLLFCFVFDCLFLFLPGLMFVYSVMFLLCSFIVSLFVYVCCVFVVLLNDVSLLF